MGSNILIYVSLLLEAIGLGLIFLFWQQKKKTIPIPLQTKEVHAERHGTEVIITLDPALAAAKHEKDNKQKLTTKVLTLVKKWKSQKNLQFAFLAACAIASLMFCFWYPKTGIILFVICVFCGILTLRMQFQKNAENAEHSEKEKVQHLSLLMVAILSAGIPALLCTPFFPKLGLFGAELLFLLVLRWVWYKWRACENFVFRPLLMGVFIFATFIWVATICTHVGSETKWQTTKTSNTTTNHPLPYR